MTTLRFNGPIAFDTADGRGVPVEVLDGARFVSIQATDAGNVEFVYLDAGNVERTFLIEIVQDSTGLTLEQVQDAVAAMLAEGDNVTLTYDDAAGQLTIAATGGGEGGGAPLSDDTPEATGAAEAGVATDASRGDHVHNVPEATTTLRGISEKATAGEATAGANNEAHMTPLRVSQVFTDRAGDADPVATDTPTVGTSTNFSREDHGHGIEQRVLNQDPNADADTLGKLPD